MSPERREDRPGDERAWFWLLVVALSLVAVAGMVALVPGCLT